MDSDPESVEEAVTSHLQLWLPAMLDDVYRAHLDTTTPPYPASWQNFDVIERWPEQAMPAILVAVPRTVSTEIHGDFYSATYACEVMAICAAASYEDVRRVTRRYATAIQMALGQHGAIGGRADSTRWVSTESMSAPSGKRNQMVAGCTFEIVVNDAMKRYAEIQTPPPPGVPPDPLPMIDDVKVTVENEGVT